MNNLLIKNKTTNKIRLRIKRGILSHKKIQNTLNKNIGIIDLKKRKNMNGL